MPQIKGPGRVTKYYSVRNSTTRASTSSWLLSITSFVCFILQFDVSDFETSSDFRGRPLTALTALSGRTADVATLGGGTAIALPLIPSSNTPDSSAVDVADRTGCREFAVLSFDMDGTFRARQNRIGASLSQKLQRWRLINSPVFSVSSVSLLLYHSAIRPWSKLARGYLLTFESTWCISHHIVRWGCPPRTRTFYIQSTYDDDNRVKIFSPLSSRSPCTLCHTSSFKFRLTVFLETDI